MLTKHYYNLTLAPIKGWLPKRTSHAEFRTSRLAENSAILPASAASNTPMPRTLNMHPGLS